MCRLIGYVGKTIQLNDLLCKPKHSLVVQSYQPQEMKSAVLNADGFGIGWHHPEREDLPYTYKNVLPIWSDPNLPQIARYIETDCFLGYVRSATAGLPVDITNCQPFSDRKLLFLHNGYINNFRTTLYRPIRNFLSDSAYQSIQGNTDSEHIWAMILSYMENHPETDLADALNEILTKLSNLTDIHETYFSANTIISDGDRLIASRYSYQESNPTLYWIKNASAYPDAVIIASEPMFEGNWESCPENSIITVEKNLEVRINPVS